MATVTSLRQLQYLVALSDKLNFTRAAEACFVTQSTLSAGPRELEDTLGARLVERDRQTVLMTPVGSEVSQRARAILAAAQDLAEVAAGARSPMTGLIRLGVIPTIAPFMLPPTLQALRERYPGLRTVLREDLTVNLLARLEEGQLDMAVIALPFETSHLLVRPLFEDPLWFVGRRGDSSLRTRTVTVTPDLSDRLLLLEEGHCLRDHALYACGVSSRTPAHGVEATSLLTLVQMVESGFGVGLVPEMAIRSGLARSPGLVARPMARPSPGRTIAIVARKSTTRLGDIDVLADLIREIGAAGAAPD